MRSCCARGERVTGSPSGEDIRVHGSATTDPADGGLRDLLQRVSGAGNRLAVVELFVTQLDHSLPGHDSSLFGLHAAHCIADHLGRIAIEAAGDLLLVDGTLQNSRLTPEL